MTRTKQKLSKHIPDKSVFSLLVILLIGLFIKNSAFASECVMDALNLCATTVIPAIFPCAVASGIFTSLGGGRLLGRLLRSPMNLLFGVSGSGVAVLMMGWLCGFPLGAITGAALLRQGEINRDELDGLLTFSSLPSPVFVISAVGEGMLGDVRLGIIIWLSLLISAVATGLFRRAFFGARYSESPAFCGETDFFAAVCDSLRSSSVAMVNLCAGVVFFSVLSRLFVNALSFLSLPPLICAAFTGILELSSGCAAAAGLHSPASPILCGFILGWSGFCVHFQVISAAGGTRKLFSYLAAKLIQGILCCALVAAFTL